MKMDIKMIMNYLHRFPRAEMTGGVRLPRPATTGLAMTNNGYVAMATVLVVGFIMLAAGMGAVLNSINEVQSSFSETQKEEAIGFVESCVQDALIDINKNDALPGSIVLPDGTCTATINSHVGGNWDITISGTYLGYKKNMRVTATRASTVTITSWIEI